MQLRDKDALKLLKEKDYDLIKSSFGKGTTKVILDQNNNKLKRLKSHGYRAYNQAYYEEILIDFFVDTRIANNYREKFLTSQSDINTVLDMYCHNDYVMHFLRLDTSSISHDQFVELFRTCLRNDAMKIAFQIYLRFMTAEDFQESMLDELI